MPPPRRSTVERRRLAHGVFCGASARPTGRLDRAAPLCSTRRVTTATKTPTELAVAIWGPAEGHSRSAGARRVRVIARRLFPADAPGKGGEWQLTPAQCDAIRSAI